MNAIVGKSGSGKTTLLNIMGLLEDSDQGDVYIAGKPVSFSITGCCVRFTLSNIISFSKLCINRIYEYYR